MAQHTAVPEGPRRTVERGRYYEDFKVGDVYPHHWGRTITDGEAQLFATATMNAVPLYFNRLHAQALGHHTPPVHPLLVMNVVFGMTVEDLSEQAIAHLGYWNMTFPRWVYPGDTLIRRKRGAGQAREREQAGPRHRPRPHHRREPARRAGLRVRAEDPGEEARSLRRPLKMPIPNPNGGALSEEHVQIRESVRDFAEREVIPVANELDNKAAEIPDQIVQQDGRARVTSG